MVLLLGALMVVVVVGWVGGPVFRPDPLLLEGVFEEDGNAHPDLEARKIGLIDAIKDLDFDFQTGKLSSQDHRQLRSRFEKNVFALYREMDERGQEAYLLGDIEREVSALREKTRRVEAQPSSCPACGGQAPSGSRYCPSCGLELRGIEK